jgi:hypothetical protein
MHISKSWQKYWNLCCILFVVLMVVVNDMCRVIVITSFGKYVFSNCSPWNYFGSLSHNICNLFFLCNADVTFLVIMLSFGSLPPPHPTIV